MEKKSIKYKQNLKYSLKKAIKEISSTKKLINYYFNIFKYVFIFECCLIL